MESWCGDRVGAVIAYFGDPDRGRSRRTRAKDRAGGALRRLRRQAQRRSRHALADLEGKLERLTHARMTALADDRALVDRVKSQVLSAPPFAGLDLLVEAVNGVVTLRGEVDSPSSMADLERKIASVPGVVDVQTVWCMGTGRRRRTNRRLCAPSQNDPPQLDHRPRGRPGRTRAAISVVTVTNRPRSIDIA